MKSVITEAKVSKRFNTGEYEFEEYTLGAAVEEGESGKQVLRELKLQINEVFSGSKAVESEEVEEKPTKKTSKKEEKKNAKSSKSNPVDDEANDDEDSSDEDAGDDVESDQDDETTDDENGDDSDDSSDDAEESSKPKGKSKEKPAKGGKKGGSKTFKAKPQSYNRTIEQHKEIFGGVLRSVAPDWKKTDKTKALAKAASAELNGEEFLDENGEVLPSFKSALMKLMKVKK